MLLKNTETQYGAITKAFHWTIALIVITLLAVGLLMGGIHDLSLKLTAYNLHKSFGITVLILMICRICWHIISRRPHEVETLKPWEKIGANIVHYSLYVLLLAQPMSGWLMSSAHPRPVSFFGLFTLPDLVGQNKDLEDLFHRTHDFIGYTLLVVVSLHILAALKHYFVDKDIVLQRMLPALALATLLMAPAAAHADVRSWNLLHDKSSITFRPKQLGQEFKGTFDTFSADIHFDPDNLANSKAVIDVQIGTAHTGAPDRDQNLKSADWFDVAQFPDAKFESTSFTKSGPDSYIAQGTVTIRNISLPVTLPFKLTIVSDPVKGDTATADGTLTLDRSKFKLGLGQWADTSIIANDVPVDIHVTALSPKAGK